MVIWLYQDSNIAEYRKDYGIRKRPFASKDVYEMVKTISKVLSNYIPDETVNFDDQDLPQINNKIKKL